MLSLVYDNVSIRSFRSRLLCWFHLDIVFLISRFHRSRQHMDMGQYQVPLQGATRKVDLIEAIIMAVIPFSKGKLVVWIVLCQTKAGNIGSWVRLAWLVNHMVLPVTETDDLGYQSQRQILLLLMVKTTLLPSLISSFTIDLILRQLMTTRIVLNVVFSGGCCFMV